MLRNFSRKRRYERVPVDEQSKLDYKIDVGFNENEDWIEFTIGPLLRNIKTEQIFLSGSVQTRFLVRDIKGLLTRAPEYSGRATNYHV